MAVDWHPSWPSAATACGLAHAERRTHTTLNRPLDDPEPASRRGWAGCGSAAGQWALGFGDRARRFQPAIRQPVVPSTRSAHSQLPGTVSRREVVSVSRPRSSAAMILMVPPWLMMTAHCESGSAPISSASAGRTRSATSEGPSPSIPRRCSSPRSARCRSWGWSAITSAEDSPVHWPTSNSRQRASRSSGSPHTSASARPVTAVRWRSEATTRTGP